MDIEAALKLGVYDENIQEIGECDSGLTWSQAGCEMWFEPTSVVDYEIPVPGKIEADDIKFFVWRWDPKLILKGYQYFEKKWNMDMTNYGRFRNFLMSINAAIGIIPRMFPSKIALKIDAGLWAIEKWIKMILGLPAALLWHLKAKSLGYYDWPVPPKKNQKS